MRAVGATLAVATWNVFDDPQLWPDRAAPAAAVLAARGGVWCVQEAAEAMASTLAGASGLVDAHRGWDTGSRVLTQFPVAASGVWGLPGTGEAGRGSQAGWAAV